MKTAFCTISTSDFLFKSYSLFDSVIKHYKTDFYCLITDSKDKIIGKPEYKIILLSDMNSNKEFSEISNKYSGNKLRWALKPVLLKYLLQNGYDSVIYCDNDIYFFNSPEYLFDKLKTKSFLLTPHYYIHTPEENQNWLEANFRVGLFNAGFIGASQESIPILQWWRDCCLYNIKKAYWRGLYDDQKYLDLIPVLFNEVEIIKDKGCNLAGWNVGNYEVQRFDNYALINNSPLTFIHFAELSIQSFSNPVSILFPEFKSYLQNLRNYNPDFNFKKNKLSFYAIRSYIYYLRWILVRFFER